MAGWREWAAGAGMGALVGFLIGLSVNSVAGGVLSALAALLAALLGLKTTGGFAGQPMRLFGFGAACSAALLAGVMIRGHDLLALSIKDRVAQWREAGYAPETALAYASWQILGVKPDDVTIVEQPTLDKRSSVLFAGTAETCAKLDPADRDAGGWIDAAAFEGGGWALAAKVVRATPPDGQAVAMRAAWEAMCAER